MKLTASYLLGHLNWHRPEQGLCPWCEEEVETAEHAILPSPARQYARGSFPEALDLGSSWYNATASEMLAKFVRCTFTAYPPVFIPPEGSGTPTSPSSPPHSLFGWVRRFLNILPSLLDYTARQVFLGWFPLVFSSGVPFRVCFCLIIVPLQAKQIVHKQTLPSSASS